ncbi:MATE family efflux transporter [Streptococcus sanguinis]|uniref:Probable multidrug resistance protein NorM n=1 Tax=Streptococcus sanguinis SK115 TaxID=888810 RepID=F0I7M9_STRSA|nr:MATE family efflux transporter [Streptococcus sanguinis]EGD31740.1 MATE family multi antimicrobial extrusion protein [Streptococcus sanguinis SK115]MBZ2052221.1 MATE family efflux transporter [Streptococcus sanguinis]MCY7012684.1 MATE family efflux transporter [Streptococcus sanguinis]MCY7032188.1 MATE family efflux transporter [Streptococcus sanguinis]
MHQTHNLNQRMRLFISIFLPILIYQLANFSASFVDTTMTGQYDTLHLAGVSMATSLWIPFFDLLIGIVSALVPIIGHHLGQGKKEKIASDFYQFIYLSLGLSLILFALVFVGAPLVLAHLGLEPLVEGVAKNYLWYLALGIIPLLLFSTIRSLFDALGLTKLSMYLMLLLLPLNGTFNYALIYGAFGFPEMGGAGAGLGTSLAYWGLLLISLLVAAKHPKVRAYELWKIRPLDKKGLIEGIQLGLPIGGTFFAEVVIFSVVGLVMAKFSSLIIASHQAAMNFSNLMYAFPMSISTSMSIIVSYEIGANRPDDVKKFCKLGRLTALGIAGFTFLFLYILRDRVAALYGSDTEFIHMTSVFLTYSLFFQLADTFAAPLQGILRGYKDTQVPFYLGLIAYWGVSLPLGLFLDYYTSLGPYGYWIGLIASLVTSGILFQWRLNRLAKNITN